VKELGIFFTPAKRGYIALCRYNSGEGDRRGEGGGGGGGGGGGAGADASDGDGTRSEDDVSRGSDDGADAVTEGSESDAANRPMSTSEVRVDVLRRVTFSCAFSMHLSPDAAAAAAHAATAAETAAAAALWDSSGRLVENHTATGGALLLGARSCLLHRLHDDRDEVVAFALSCSALR
jgi:hypothetical protein